MHYLGLALYAEGPTDYNFLRPLLLRLCVDVCTEHANGAVEFNEEVLALDHPASANDARRDERIIRAALRARGAWRIVFVHSDGEGSPNEARRQLVQPALTRLETDCAGEGAGVAVVPVRETEAWALADGNSLRSAFGTNLSDTELGLPPLSKVESVLDPKAHLLRVFQASNPSPRSKRSGPSPRLEILGETVSLAHLRKLQSFRRLESDLKLALVQLGILPQGGVAKSR